jgi:hypothetical protein
LRKIFILTAPVGGGSIPGPAPMGGGPVPGPAPVGGDPVPGPAPVEGGPVPGLAPMGGGPVPGPAPVGGGPIPGPAPVRGDPVPGLAPEGGGPVQLPPSPQKDHRYGCQPFLKFFSCVRLVILRGILPDEYSVFLLSFYTYKYVRFCLIVETIASL